MNQDRSNDKYKKDTTIKNTNLWDGNKTEQYVHSDLLCWGLWELKPVCASSMTPSLPVWHPTHPGDSIQFRARCRFKISQRIGCLIVGSCPLPPSRHLFHTLTRFIQQDSACPLAMLPFSLTLFCTSEILVIFLPPLLSFFLFSGLDSVSLWMASVFSFFFQTSWSSRYFFNPG